VSWHYLQGQEVGSSEAICWDGQQFAPSKSRTTLGEYCLLGSATGPCHGSQSGMTSPPSTGDPGEGESTLSAAGFHARTSAPPERAPESRDPAVVYGGRWRELSVKYDPDSSSWKTHRCLFDEDLPWSSVILPRWGSMLGGVCWEHITPGHPTSGTGSGYSRVSGGGWPTPNASDGAQGAVTTPERMIALIETGRPAKRKDGGEYQVKLQEMVVVRTWPTPTVNGNYNRKGASATSGDGLATAVKPRPTPRSTDGSHGGRVTPRKSREGGSLIEAVSARMWPTPTASTGGPEPEGKTGRKLATVVMYPTPRSGTDTMCGGSGHKRMPQGTALEKGRGQLNPNWVEWLMGWPIGWTDLKQSATARYRQWLRLHGVPLGDPVPEPLPTSEGKK